MWMAATFMLMLAILFLVLRALIVGVEIFNKSCTFAENLFSKKQRDWEDSLRAAATREARGVRSEIHRHPIGNFLVLTVALLIVLIIAVSDDKPMIAYIAFAFWFLFLLGEGIAWRNFGATYFLFDSAFSPGGKVAGRIYFQRESAINYDFISRVECIREYGAGEAFTRTALWSSERKISAQDFGIGPTAQRYIPIEFDLPASTLESSNETAASFHYVKVNYGDRIIWELSVRPAPGSWPGTFEGKALPYYKDRFEIPVFRAQPSPGSPTAAA